METLKRQQEKNLVQQPQTITELVNLLVAANIREKAREFENQQSQQLQAQEILNSANKSGSNNLLVMSMDSRRKSAGSGLMSQHNESLHSHVNETMKRRATNVVNQVADRFMALRKSKPRDRMDWGYKIF